MTLDATVYPADAAYFHSALQILSTVCHFGPHCIAHVQFPVPQSNTTTQALLNHHRTIEDTLHSKGVDINHKMSLHFQKPADSTAQDKRKIMQSCMACFSDAERLMWDPPTVISQLPLIKISDMRGYDAETRPGPSARAEQRLDCSNCFQNFCVVFQLTGGRIISSLSVLHTKICVRKGVPVHDKIIKAYLDGLGLRAQDQICLLDLVCNRRAGTYKVRWL